MNRKLYNALEYCLQRMEQGETLDSVMTHFPDLVEQLRPLLVTAVRARSAKQRVLPPAILARERSHGLALAADLRKRKSRFPYLRGFWRPTMTIASAIAILVMSGNGLLIASAHSIPGDTLYPLKRAVETTQLHFVHDPVEEQELQQTFSERRVDETRSLITIQRVENVHFTGVLTSWSDGKWLVSGIPVIITTQTQGDAGIRVGDNVEVDGSTDPNGRVEASRLSLVVSSTKNVDDPVSPTQVSTQDGNMETTTESSTTPTYSDNYEDQGDSWTDQPTPTPAGDDSYPEGTRVFEHHSEDGGDH